MWQVAADLTGALDRAMAAATDPVERLRALVTELTGAIIENRQTFAVYWKELYTIPDDVRVELRRGERAFVDGVESLVVAAQQAGALPPEQPSWVLAEGILGMLSWVYQWYRPDGPLDAAGIATAFNRLLGSPTRPPAHPDTPSGTPCSAELTHRTDAPSLTATDALTAPRRDREKVDRWPACLTVTRTPVARRPASHCTDSP